MVSLVLAEGEERVLAFANALERRDLRLSSSAGELQARLGLSQPRIRPYQDLLRVSSDVGELVVALRLCTATVTQVLGEQPLIEVAWTSPSRGHAGSRTTGGVAREIISSSRVDLLVVGYSLTVDPTLTGLAAQTLGAIACAAKRGVRVTAVLHREVDPTVLVRFWEPGVVPPTVFTWPSVDDDLASVHAKLLISDRSDALVTSANLTYHGFQKNLEMGLRVKGSPAREIHDRVHELIADGTLIEVRC